MILQVLSSIIFAWPSKPWLSQVHLQNQTGRTITTPSKPSYEARELSFQETVIYPIQVRGIKRRDPDIWCKVLFIQQQWGIFPCTPPSSQPPSSFSPPASLDSSFFFYSWLLLFSDFFLMIIFLWRCDWLSNHFNQSDSNIFRDSGMLREDFDWIESWYTYNLVF